MATYRALQDISLGASWPYITAGQILTDTGPKPNIPKGWRPPGGVDPLDQEAVLAFHAMGPQLPGMVRVARGVTRWEPRPNPTHPRAREYVLTGLGAGLPFRQHGVNAASFGGVHP